MSHNLKIENWFNLSENEKAVTFATLCGWTLVDDDTNYYPYYVNIKQNPDHKIAKDIFDSKLISSLKNISLET
jgi:hypothetical protein